MSAKELAEKFKEKRDLISNNVASRPATKEECIRFEVYSEVIRALENSTTEQGSKGEG